MNSRFNDLSNLIASLPGIGQKSASRISFYLLRQSDHYISHFIESISSFHKSMEFCRECGALKDKNSACSLCSATREQSIICVVEQPSDAFTIEKSGDYRGLYHVLMGNLSPLDGIGPEDIRLNELMTRIRKNTALTEIILATNPNLEGNATANYIADLMKDFGTIKVSRIAMGLAIGSQIEYADSTIISQSIRNRTYF